MCQNRTQDLHTLRRALYQLRHSNFLVYGAGPGRLSMAHSPLPTWGPIHKVHTGGVGGCGRARPNRYGAGPALNGPWNRLALKIYLDGLM